MTSLLVAGPLLLLAGLLIALALLHLASGPDREAEERARFRRAAELEGIRQEREWGWLNEPATRRKPNRHDRRAGRSRDYTGVA